MLPVEKPAHPPQKLTSPEVQHKCDEALKEKNKHHFSNHYYAAPEVTTQLKALYHSKCAFCETNTAAGAALQVDHYRPKKQLQDDPNHLGYYWLGYEWTNLILACQKCNRAKSNHFPIAGKRVWEPQANPKEWKLQSTSFLAEQPLLLNPEYDAVADYFEFNANGEIHPVQHDSGSATKSETTIALCNLNREDLVIARKTCLDNLLYRGILPILKLVQDYQQKFPDKFQSEEDNFWQEACQIIQDHLFQSQTPEAPYTLFMRYAVSQLEDFIPIDLSPDRRRLLQDLLEAREPDSSIE